PNIQMRRVRFTAGKAFAVRAQGQRNGRGAEHGEGPRFRPNGVVPVWPPDLDRAILAAAHNAPAVAEQRHARDRFGVSFQAPDFLAGGRVPYPHRFVFAAADNPFAVATPGDAGDLLRVSPER